MISRIAFAARRSQYALAQFSSVNIGEVSRANLLASNDHKWVGQYVKAVTMAPAGQVGEHASHIDEYFRKSFRKLTARQALDILEPLAQSTTEKALCLDSSFWTWESLEEAVRGDLDQFNHEEFMTVLKAFNFNYKGSRDLLDLLEQRIYGLEEPKE